MGKNHIVRYTWNSPVRLLMCISLFSSMVFYAPVSLLVRTRMGITLEQFFILQAILSATIFFFEIPSGFLSDFFGYRQTIILSFLLNFAARILMLLAQDFRMFAAEAVLEGMAAALNSGTISGYVYSISGRDSYNVDMAEINRCSDLGFLVSTLGFSVIYQFLGMRGLLFGTAAAAFAAFFVSCGLQECPVQREQKTDHRSSGRWKDAGKEPGSHPGLADLVCVLGISLASLAFLLVNFFYVTILGELGMDETYMTAVILLYTAVQILIPWIIQKRKQLQKGRSRKHLNDILSSLAAVLVFAVGIAWTENFFVLIPMLLLPAALQLLQIDVETYQNLCIDRKGLSKNRVTVLSGYSMVSNALEIGFLFGSSQIGTLGIRPLFWGLGILVLFAMGIVVLLRRKEIRR